MEHTLYNPLDSFKTTRPFIRHQLSHQFVICICNGFRLFYSITTAFFVTDKSYAFSFQQAVLFGVSLQAFTACYLWSVKLFAQVSDIDRSLEQRLSHSIKAAGLKRFGFALRTGVIEQSVIMFLYIYITPYVACESETFVVSVYKNKRFSTTF